MFKKLKNWMIGRSGLPDPDVSDRAAQVLVEYVSITARYGLTSPQARAFEQKYAGDSEITELFEAHRRVKEFFTFVSLHDVVLAFGSLRLARFVADFRSWIHSLTVPRAAWLMGQYTPLLATYGVGSAEEISFVKAHSEEREFAELVPTARALKYHFNRRAGTTDA